MRITTNLYTVHVYTRGTHVVHVVHLYRAYTETVNNSENAKVESNTEKTCILVRFRWSNMHVCECVCVCGAQSQCTQMLCSELHIESTLTPHCF